MWVTVLGFAMVCALEPTRIAIAGLLVALPRPCRNLLVFWLGMLTAGTAFAVAGLYVVSDYVAPIVNVVHSAFDSPIIPPIKIVAGLLAISATVWIVVRAKVRGAVPVPVPVPVPVSVGGPSECPSEWEPTPPKKRSIWAPFVITPGTWSGWLGGGSLGMAYVAGLFTAAPPLEFWGAMLTILVSGAAAGTQVGATLLFMIVGYSIAEIPLICYLAAPVKTRAVVTRLHDWLQANRRPVAIGAMGTFGVLMVVGGVGGI
jgi:hypothetical protein